MYLQPDKDMGNVMTTLVLANECGTIAHGSKRQRLLCVYSIYCVCVCVPSVQLDHADSMGTTVFLFSALQQSFDLFCATGSAPSDQS